MLCYPKIILLATTLLIGCSSLTPTPIPTPINLEQAKEDIYRALASPYCNYGTVYIDSQIVAHPMEDKEIEYIQRDFRILSQELLNNFILANNQTEPLGKFSEFPIDCNYQFTTPDTKVWCNDIHCITPIGFSPIGFSESGIQAMVFMYWSCSECGGWTRIYFLEKQNDSWIVVHYVQLSIS